FYGSLFGWQFEDTGADFGHYQMGSLDGRSVGAIGPKPPGMEQMPSVWNTYLAVADADKTAAKITEAGGQLFMPPGDIGDSGRMAGRGGACRGARALVRVFRRHGHRRCGGQDRRTRWLRHPGAVRLAIRPDGRCHR